MYTSGETLPEVGWSLAPLGASAAPFGGFRADEERALPERGSIRLVFGRNSAVVGWRSLDDERAVLTNGDPSRVVGADSLVDGGRSACGRRRNGSRLQPRTQASRDVREGRAAVRASGSGVARGVLVEADRLSGDAESARGACGSVMTAPRRERESEDRLRRFSAPDLQGAGELPDCPDGVRTLSEHCPEAGRAWRSHRRDVDSHANARRSSSNARHGVALSPQTFEPCRRGKSV